MTDTLFHRWRVPLPALIGVAVVVAHALFFWLIWNKHFMPKVPPPSPTPPLVNFGFQQRQGVDPQSGATVTEQEFTVSTQLATPTPAPASFRTP